MYLLFFQAHQLSTFLVQMIYHTHFYTIQTSSIFYSLILFRPLEIIANIWSVSALKITQLVLLLSVDWLIDSGLIDYLVLWFWGWNQDGGLSTILSSTWFSTYNRHIVYVVGTYTTKFETLWSGEGIMIYKISEKKKSKQGKLGNKMI